MGSYLMMLYVTVDQELALKSYFTQQGWPFKKPDLKVTTEELGGVVQNCLQDPEEPQRPTPALQEKHPSNKRKAPQKQRLPAKVARQVLPTVDNNVPSNEVQDSVETSTAYEDIVAKVEKKDEVNEYHVATSKTVNNIVIEGEDFIVKEELPDSNDESDNDTIDNDFDIAEESGVDSKVEPPEDIPETRTLDEPGTCSEILVGASGQKESSIKKQQAMDSSSEDEFESTQATARQGSDCAVCGKSFKTRSGLQRHVSVHGAFKFKCEICDREFHNKYNWKEHIKRRHSAIQHLCSHCGGTFTTQYALKKHEQIVHEKYPMFQCSICDRVFSSKEVYNAHCIRHTSKTLKKPYKCLKCGHGFLYTSTLARHMKTCSSKAQKPKPTYVCEICQKQFSLARLLKQHKRVHEDPRYSCHVCGRTFNWKNCLDIHLKTCFAPQF
ncbi:zinc finger protein 37-like isoform X1 [Mya arenaria]|uniref:zinc finger protein 37-like isoform X1 n=1 Tax=Mya arenaria TaxID=6604 RepID=UPI0022E0FE0B|nr:zinc finger protein 37-like isoform X1 [Mya arenaria]XP_052771532.1 zinc finger protein 37-like isoform X1 [Mya arenaria]XP_052771533.1 zinc finger protein 37-like isoform X1 [Mya arenaria]XP_052771733.1 zinc finger protein 37-like isoform X1 [Mya arenaria]XP_052771734.1 zinc finger protein 37-like isoform X1 [Mya arenaria]